MICDNLCTLVILAILLSVLFSFAFGWQHQSRCCDWLCRWKRQNHQRPQRSQRSQNFQRHRRDSGWGRGRLLWWTFCVLKFGESLLRWMCIESFLVKCGQPKHPATQRARGTSTRYCLYLLLEGLLGVPHWRGVDPNGKLRHAHTQNEFPQTRDSFFVDPKWL